jgi:fatty acid desaturase
LRESTFEDARDGFAAHAALYVLVMAALIVLNFSFLTGFWWSAIPLVAWGIALALHYLHLRRLERAEADRRADRVKPAA